MSTASPAVTQAERRQLMAATTIEWSSFSILLTVYVSLFWDVIITSQLTQASFEMQLQLCPEWAQE